ncbi:hypothetical protein Dsin_033166 [Dipteronia sinensis]|uniref:Type VI secretion system protein ImpL n=1 Tax=Dipteronia sinensis TaxID=43782 RepID=A0AAD9Z613_9ROSI|nr:hypothetical protein Dsin_033166 [Dipteronia sinensis]
MVHWYEGMLLLPEHFRAQARRQEMLSGYLAHAAAPYAWGLRRMQHEIVGTVYRVTALEAIMPDGLLVTFDAAAKDAVSLEIDMSGFSLDIGDAARMLIHLVVPVLQPRFFGQDDAEAGGLARYQSVQGVPLELDDPDRAWGDAASELARERPWYRPILRLHATLEGKQLPPRQYVAMPLVRIKRDALSRLVEDRYEPPRPLIGGATLLTAVAQGIATELDAKATYLKERLRRVRMAPVGRDATRSPRPNVATATGEVDRAAVLSALNAEMRLLRQRVEALQQNVDNLQALARTLPRLKLLLADPLTHPRAVYEALHDVAGDVALIGGDLSLPEVRAYDHLDPLAGFDMLGAHILQILRTLGQRYTVMAFDRIKDGRFELALAPDQLKRHFVIGAVRAPEEPAEGIRHWMANAVIGTINHKGDIRRMRVGGAERHEIDRDRDLELEAPPLTTLFHVDATTGTFSENDAVLFVDHLPADAPAAADQFRFFYAALASIRDDIVTLSGAAPAAAADADGVRLPPTAAEVRVRLAHAITALGYRHEQRRTLPLVDAGYVMAAVADEPAVGRPAVHGRRRPARAPACRPGSGGRDPARADRGVSRAVPGRAWQPDHRRAAARSVPAGARRGLRSRRRAALCATRPEGVAADRAQRARAAAAVAVAGDAGDRAAALPAGQPCHLVAGGERHRRAGAADHRRLARRCGDAAVTGWGWLAYLLLALLVLLVVVLALLVWRAGGIRQLWRDTGPDDFAAGPPAKPVDLAPPARMGTAIAVALRELQQRVAGGRKPADVPWIMAVGVDADELSAMLPPSETPRQAVSWTDEERLARVGTIDFRDGGVAIGFSDGLLDGERVTHRLGALLKELEIVRPDRPIDAVTVVVPWETLAVDVADDTARAAIVERGTRLYEVLLLIQQRTGWRVPVHVVVSRCEQVPGFGPYAEAALTRSDNPVIGWPAPWSLDTAFETMWIDEAFDTLRKALSMQQFHLLMGIADEGVAEEVMLFPGRLTALKPALTILLTQMLASSAYHEGFMLRGVFLAGASSPRLNTQPLLLSTPFDPTEDESIDLPTPEPLPPPPDAVEPPVAPAAEQRLAQALFAAKIFPETRLAQPAYGERTRRHRMIRRTQTALAAAVFVSILGYAGIAYGNDRLLPPVKMLLEQIAESQEEAAKLRAKTRDPATGECRGDAVLPPGNVRRPVEVEQQERLSIGLLERMADVDLNRVQSPLAPTSYLTRANYHIQQAIAASFRDVVFHAIAQSMATGIGIRTLIERDTAAADPDMQWSLTVKNVRDYDVNYRLLDRLARATRGDASAVADFAAVVRYALAEAIPPKFARNFKLYSRGIAGYAVPCIGSVAVRGAIERLVAEDYAEAVDRFYRQNALARAVDTIDARFGPDGTVVSDESLRLLAGELDTIATELAFPGRYAWIAATRAADLPLPQTTRLGKLNVLSPDFLTRLDGSGRPVAIAAAARLREATLADEPILAVAAAPAPAGLSDAAAAPPAAAPAGAGPALSQPMTDTQSYLRLLFAQSFMNHARGGAVDEIRFGGPGWDYQRLQDVRDALKSYVAFLAAGSGQMPTTLRDGVQQTARRHLADVLAQSIELATPATDPRSSVTTEQFIRELPSLTALRNDLNAARLDDVAARLDTKVAQRAADQFAAADTELSRGGYYTIDPIAVRRWNGTGSLAATAFGASDPDDLAVQLAQWRGAIAAIASNRAAPLVTYLSDPATVPAPSGGARLAFWRTIIDTLRAYDAKTPNSLTRLETFITTVIDRSSRDCGALAAGGGGRGDYFAARQAAIAAQVAQRCRGVTGTDTRVRFTQVRDAFAAALAGRFPFARDADAPGADPDDVRRFFARYGDVLLPLKAEIDAADGPDTAAADALQRLADARAALAPMLAEAGGGPLAYQRRDADRARRGADRARRVRLDRRTAGHGRAALGSERADDPRAADRPAGRAVRPARGRQRGPVPRERRLGAVAAGPPARGVRRGRLRRGGNAARLRRAALPQSRPGGGRGHCRDIRARLSAAVAGRREGRRAARARGAAALPHRDPGARAGPMTPDAVAALLVPIADAAPAGRDVRHEGDYDRIGEARREENAALPRGVWGRDVKQADWIAVERLCTATLRERSKDLRVACWLCEAWVQRHGFAGMAPGLALVEGLMRDFWNDLFPPLDDGDPGARAAAVAWLDQRLPVVLRLAPIADARDGDGMPLTWSMRLDAERLEAVRLRDEAAAKKAEAGGATTPAIVEAATQRLSSDGLETIATALHAGLAALESLDDALDALCRKDAPGLGRTRDVATDIARWATAVLAERALAALPIVVPAPVPIPVPTSPTRSPSDRIIEASTSAGTGTPMIASRDEAYAALAQVVAFLHAAEPHSPVPHVLERMLEWETMTLIEIDVALRSGGSGVGQLLDALLLVADDDFADETHR